MADGRSAQCQWYQSGDVVTASLKLGKTRKGAITAKFEENHCSLFDGDELYWECHLWGTILPDQCRVIPGKVRAEIKLKKAEPVLWTDFEIEEPDGAVVTNGLPNHTPSKVATATPIAPMVSTPVFRPEEEMHVNHLPHDYYDLGDDKVRVKVQLSGLEKSSCSVLFREHSLELRFKTRDSKFLRMYEGTSSSTTFVWSIRLFAGVDPDLSSHTIRADHLEILLRKTTTVRWKTLESSVQRHQITSINSTSNQNESTAPPPNQNHESVNSASNQNQATAGNDQGVSIKMNNLNLDPSPKSMNKSGIWSSAEVPHSDENHFGVELNQDIKDTNVHSSSTKLTTRAPQSSSIVSQSHSDTTYPSQSTSQYSSNEPPVITGSKVVQSIPPAALEVTDPSYRTSQLCKPCLTGLVNLGNSCFMNSVIQCLSNTGNLRDYFIDGRYLADLNKKNPLGFNGELAKCFSQVVRKLWSGEYESLQPKKLKSIISSRSGHFGGYQQHDAHEFMSYLLDGLHEDLNRVREKPLTSPVEGEGRPDVEVARECWEVHRKRNDSFLVDSFQGQFKSTLVCPHCSKVSVTFDPYMALSVPIPQNLRHLPVIFVPCDPDATPIQYVLKLSPEGNLELLKASVARKTGILMTQLRVFEAYNGKFQSLLSSNQHPISSIKESDVIIVSEVLSQQTAGGPVVEMNVIQRVQVPLFPTKCSACGRLASELKKIQRCGLCKAVGYCDRKCQENDWSSHKLKCRHGRPTPVGLPFVISLPSSQLTYSKLSTAAEKFAKRSVKVTRRERSGSSIQENPESVGENPEHMYVLVPVDRYGDNKESCEPLSDKGGEVLHLEGQFLAMDWRNNPKDSHSVTVTPKPTLDHTPDPASTADSNDKDKDFTLDQCLELFTEPELLTKDEAWYCSSCKEHREATKQISVWRLPRILILHLKRFSFKNMRRRDKIDKMVTFPVRGLDMSPYMLGDASKTVSSESPPIYDLFALVNHYGILRIDVGHYTAMVKPPSTEGLEKNDWLCYDDDSVYRLPEGKVPTKEAYILFYVQREQKPRMKHKM